MQAAVLSSMSIGGPPTATTTTTTPTPNLSSDSNTSTSGSGSLQHPLSFAQQQHQQQQQQFYSGIGYANGGAYFGGNGQQPAFAHQFSQQHPQYPAKFDPLSSTAAALPPSSSSTTLTIANGGLNPAGFNNLLLSNHNSNGGGGHIGPTGSTIINESDFPHLGVNWALPSFGGDGSGGDAAYRGGALSATSSSSSPFGIHQPGVYPPQPQQGQQGGQYQAALFGGGGRDALAMHAASMTRPYANLIREGSAMSNNEFRMQNEDFPALPASNNPPLLTPQPTATNQQQPGLMKSSDQPSSAPPTMDSSSSSSGGSAHLDHHQHQQPLPMMQQRRAAAQVAMDARQVGGSAGGSTSPTMDAKQGIQTHPDGLVTNIPPGMLNDQFGMAGLLTFLRTIESDPSIVELALGHDLTNLGLNLNSSKRNLYQTFSPWASYPCRVQDLDAKVPDEYLTNSAIATKLPNIKMNKFSEDVLFYLFYNCPGEVYQIAAASELYSRQWRWHTKECCWLTRSPFATPQREQMGTYEKGSYNVFDPTQWRKIPKEMVIEYTHLEGKPSPISGGGTATTPGAAPPPTNSNTSTTIAPMTSATPSSGGNCAPTPSEDSAAARK